MRLWRLVEGLGVRMGTLIGVCEGVVWVVDVLAFLLRVAQRARFRIRFFGTQPILLKAVSYDPSSCFPGKSIAWSASLSLRRGR
jgi:hypothetical protein